MAGVRWIKITTDMFDNRKIKHLRKLPEGNNIALIWIMLLTIAGRCNSGGAIFLTDDIPYTTKMLASELGFKERTVKEALAALEQLNMIVMDGDYFTITGWDEHQNIEGMEKIRAQTRQRNIEYRKRKSENRHGDVTVTSHDATDIEIEEDKEIDKDLEKEQEERNPLAVAEDNELQVEDPELAKVATAVMDKLGLLSSTAVAEMQTYYRQMGSAVLLHALDVSVDAGKRSWAYMRGILRGYSSRGTTDLDSVIAAEQEFDRGKRLKNGQSSVKNHPALTLAELDRLVDRI